MNKPNKELKERPIICRPHEVRAILDGRKTQTRRVVKIQPPADGFELSRLIESTSKADAKNEGRLHWIKRDGLRIIANDKRFFSCPYGQPCCDRLWLREKYTLTNHGDPVYFADFKDKRGDYWHSIAVDPKDVKWKSPIFMPRAASRITLEITDIRVERLQDISENDAVAEGVEFWTPTVDVDPVPSPRPAYRLLWESINGAGSWGLNPWVFVIEFKRVTP